MHTYTITIIPMYEFMKTLHLLIMQNFLQTILKNNYEKKKLVRKK